MSAISSAVVIRRPSGICASIAARAASGSRCDGQPARVHRREDLRGDHRVHPHAMRCEVHRPFPREPELPRLRRDIGRRPALPRQRRLGGDVHDRPPRRDQRVAAEMRHRVVVHEVAVERGAERRRARVEARPGRWCLRSSRARRSAPRAPARQPPPRRRPPRRRGPPAARSHPGSGRSPRAARLRPRAPRPPPRRCPTRRRSRSRPCPASPRSIACLPVSRARHRALLAIRFPYAIHTRSALIHRRVPGLTVPQSGSEEPPRRVRDHRVDVHEPVETELAELVVDQEERQPVHEGPDPEAGQHDLRMVGRQAPPAPRSGSARSRRSPRPSARVPPRSGARASG